MRMSGPPSDYTTGEEGVWVGRPMSLRDRVLWFFRATQCVAVLDPSGNRQSLVDTSGRVTVKSAASDIADLTTQNAYLAALPESLSGRWTPKVISLAVLDGFGARVSTGIIAGVGGKVVRCVALVVSARVAAPGNTGTMIGTLSLLDGDGGLVVGICPAGASSRQQAVTTAGNGLYYSYAGGPANGVLDALLWYEQV